MNKAYFKPWKGDRFSSTRLLIVGEAAYSWRDNGELHVPPRTHPEKSLKWSLKHFGKVRYFSQMSRALCGTECPTQDEMKRAWDEYGYTIYVQGTVGVGARSKPTRRQFRDAAICFLQLIETIRPSKIIVTGLRMWRNMPSPVAKKGKLKAYALQDGTLVWCMALPHPANRTIGFNWKTASKAVRRFKSATLPRSVSKYTRVPLAEGVGGTNV